MYFATSFLTPDVVFTNPYGWQIAAWHQIAGDASGAAIPALQASAQPTIAGLGPAATTIDAHATLNQLAGDGFVSAAADQQRLSVDDQLNPDGTISGHLNDGTAATNNFIPVPPVGIPDSPEPNTKPRQA